WTAGGATDEATTAIAPDNDGTYHMALSFTDSATIGGLRVNSLGGADTVLGTLNSTGRRFEKIGAIAGSGDESITHIVIDASGARYYAATTNSNVTIEAGSASRTLDTSNTDQRSVLFSVTPDDEIGWVSEVAGTDIQLHDLELRTNGDLIAVGEFSSTATLRAAGSENLHKAAIELDGFTISLAKSGEPQQFNTYGGNGEDGISSVAVQPDGRVVIGGYFSDTIQLSNGANPIELTARARTDSLLAQLRAEHDQVAGDVNGDRRRTAADIDALFLLSRSDEIDSVFDFNHDRKIDQFDINQLVINELRSTYGDSNLDGVFNPQDFVTVFQFAEYEDGIDGNSGWGEGDWNGDGDFNSTDFVFVFRWGTYTTAASPRLAEQLPLSRTNLRSLFATHEPVDWQGLKNKGKRSFVS
ncbi:MAG: hypothetical protein KDB27_01280, partial [Planctomycetales bacterium]|nr:hypothetical protein [Planctomycetales bacterium]